MATRRDDRAGTPAGSFSSDPFFADPPPPAGRTMGLGASEIRRAVDARAQHLDDDDLLEEDEPFVDEATRVQRAPEAWQQEGTLDDTDDNGGFDDERTTVWGMGPEPEPEPWPTPAPAPIVYASRPAPQRTTGSAQAVSSRPAANRATGPSAAVPPGQRASARPGGREPQGQALHYGSPGIAEVAPRRAPTPSQDQRVIVADAAPAAVAPAVNAGSRSAPPAVPPTQPASSNSTTLVLGLALVAALAAILFLVFRPSAPVPTAPQVAVQPATLAVFTTPPGATVRINGAPHPQVTPTIVSGLTGGTSYAVTVELAGYQPVVETLVADPAQPMQRTLQLAPVAGSVIIASVPPGAAIALDGTPRGVAPQTLDGLDMSRVYQVSATLDGHTPVTQSVRWTPGSPSAQNITLTLMPAVVAGSGAPAAEASSATQSAAAAPATPAPRQEASSSGASPPRESSRTSSPDRAPEERPAASTAPERPSGRPSARPSGGAAATEVAAGAGTVSVQAVPFGQVWIDNRMVANETPLLNHELSAGVHTVKVYFTELRTFSDERSIRIEPGSSRTLTFRAPPQ